MERAGADVCRASGGWLGGRSSCQEVLTKLLFSIPLKLEEQVTNQHIDSRLFSEMQAFAMNNSSVC